MENYYYYEGDEGYNSFHSDIEDLLRDGQVVTVHIPAFDSYFSEYGSSDGKVCSYLIDYVKRLVGNQLILDEFACLPLSFGPFILIHLVISPLSF